MKQVDIDKLFKHKLADREYDFDEQAWIAAKKLLAVKKKKRKAFFIWCAFGLLVGTFAVGWIYNYSVNKEEVETWDMVDRDKENDFPVASKGIENDTRTIAAIAADESVHKKEVANPQENVISKKKEAYNALMVATRKIANSEFVPEDYTSPRLEGPSSNPLVVTKTPQAVESFEAFKKIDELAQLETKLLSDISEVPLTLKAVVENEDFTRSWFNNVGISAGIGTQSQHLQSALSRAYSFSAKTDIEVGINYHWARANNLRAHRGNLANYNALRKLFFKSTIEADQFHMAGIFSKVHYHLDKRHSLNIGFLMERLLLTRGTIREEELDSRATWIVETGLTRNHLSGLTGYSFAINSKWQLSIDAQWALNDVFVEGISQSAYLSHTRIGLRRKF